MYSLNAGWSASRGTARPVEGGDRLAQQVQGRDQHQLGAQPVGVRGALVGQEVLGGLAGAVDLARQQPHQRDLAGDESPVPVVEVVEQRFQALGRVLRSVEAEGQHEGEVGFLPAPLA
jgi:hypothetical protein